MDYSLQPLPITKYFEEGENRKDKLIRLVVDNMIRRTSSMFEWKSDTLFEKMTPRYLELCLQVNGFACIALHKGNYYCLYGHLGGEYNYEYMPRNIVVANPYLNLSKTYDIYKATDVKNINNGCVIIPNDTLYRGLIPLLSYRAEMITEARLTRHMRNIIERMPKVFTAPDNNAYRDIKDLFRDLENGKFGAIYDKNILKDIGSLNLSEKGDTSITSLIEEERFEEACMFNEVGLRLNYNMKRESITSSEVQLDEDAIFPLTDNMLEYRKLGCKQLKEFFGIDVEVEFSSAWKKNEIVNELDIDKLENGSVK